MCALAHVFETAGLATVGLALVREHAVASTPPRMLNVDFPLGRPLGRPNDASFQRDVLLSAFGLLERTDLPVLVDYPERIEDQSEEPASCPLPPTFDVDLPPAIDEAKGLRSAYQRNLDATGRTLVGRQGGPEEIPDLIGIFLELEGGASLDDVGWDEWKALAAAHDIRAYYEEAAVQLADITGARQAESWFYQKTQTGQLMRRLVAVLRQNGSPDLLHQYLVPMTQIG